MQLLEDRRFYVYVYLDPRKPGKYVYGEYEFDYEPFYVGKGYGNRKNDHLVESGRNFKKGNQCKLNKIRKIQRVIKEDPIIIEYAKWLTEEESIYKYEIPMINNIGRIDKGMGPLTNLTDGGQGLSGWVPTDDTVKKMRDSSKIRWDNPKNREHARLKTLETFERLHIIDWTGKISREYWKDENNRKEQSIRMSIVYGKSENRKIQSEKAKNAWKNKEYRQQQIERLKKYRPSEETKKKISIATARDNNPRARIVVVNGIFFGSIISAADFENITGASMNYKIRNELFPDYRYATETEIREWREKNIENKEGRSI